MKQSRFSLLDFFRFFRLACLLISLTISLTACTTQKQTDLTALSVPEDMSNNAVESYAYLSYSHALIQGDESGLIATAPLLKEVKAPPTIWLEGAAWLMTKSASSILPFIKEAMQTWPDNISINLVYAEALANNGLIETAFKVMQDFLERNPDSIDAKLELALLFVKTNRFAEAEELLNNIQASARTPLVEYYHARALIGMDRSKEAMTYLQKAVKGNSNFIEAMLELAFLYEQNKNYKEAIKLYEKLLKRNIVRDKVILRLVGLCLSLGENEKANKYATLGSENPVFQIALAGVFLEEKRYKQAEKILMQLAEFEGAPADVFLLLADLTYEQQHNLEKACAWLDRLPESGRDAVRGEMLRIQLHGQDKQWAKAVEIARENQKTFPDEVDFIILEIQMFIGAEQKDEAFNTAKKLAKWNQDENASFLYGSILDEQGKKAEAFKIMEDIISKFPNNHQALNYVGYTLAEQGKDLDRALELLRKADQLSPNQSYIIDSLAWALFKKGQLEEAWQEIKRAVAQEGEIDPTIWEHYVEIANSAGYPEDAAKAQAKLEAKKTENKGD